MYSKKSIMKWEEMNKVKILAINIRIKESNILLRTKMTTLNIQKKKIYSTYEQGTITYHQEPLKTLMAGYTSTFYTQLLLKNQQASSTLSHNQLCIIHYNCHYSITYIQIFPLKLQQVIIASLYSFSNFPSHINFMDHTAFSAIQFH